MPVDPKLPQETPSKDITTTPVDEIINRQLDDALAKDLVLKSFSEFENFRSRNHDARWTAQDSLYFSYVPPKVWPGTTVARANIGLPLTFAKVETALPAIVQSLFYTGGDFFQVDPRGDATKEQAREWQDVISYLLEHPVNDFGHTVIGEMTGVIRQLLLYGNGGIRLFYDPRLKRPTIEEVDIRNFYIDPKTPNPSIDKARAVIERTMLTVEDLASLIEADPKFRQLSKENLQALAMITPAAVADTTMRMQEAFKGVNFDPSHHNWIPNPAGRQIEVLVYYSKDKIVWVLNRHTVIYNEKNPYGFIPFCFAPCYPVPGRFYAQSISDIQEGFQRYSEALLNGHLDEIALALHPPRALPRSAVTTPSQQRWFPGAALSYDDPKQVHLLQPSAQLTNVFTDINLLEVMAEKTTGISSLGMGVPRPGNANRTAAGMQMQLEGSSSRLLPIIIAIESFMLIPMLYKLYHMLRLHTPLGQNIPALNESREVYNASAEIIDKPVKFTMLASSKMLTREKLQQIVPFLLQTLVQGPMMQGLAAANLTIDFTELARMIQEATGVTKQYQLVRPLNEQEMATKQQPSPDAVAQRQEAQQDRELRLQLQDMQSQTELQKVQMQKQPDPAEQEAAALKLQFERASKEMEFAAKRQEIEQKVQQKRMEMAMKAEETEQKRQLTQFNLQTELEKALAQQQIAAMAPEPEDDEDEYEPSEGELKRMARPARKEEPRRKAEVKKKD